MAQAGVDFNLSPQLIDNTSLLQEILMIGKETTGGDALRTLISFFIITFIARMVFVFFSRTLNTWPGGAENG